VKLLFSGHYQDEVWGLAPHPVRPSVVATCGDDMTLRVWRTDQADHQCLAGKNCSFGTVWGGGRVVVGTDRGR
jgi:microtubule-associated protein-like 6